MTGSTKTDVRKLWQFRSITPASASKSIKGLACATYLNVNSMRRRSSAAVAIWNIVWTSTGEDALMMALHNPGNGRVCEFGSWQPQTGPAAERRLKGSQTGVWCMIYAALVLPACQNCALLPSNPATIVVTLENLRYDRESHVVFAVPRTGPGRGRRGMAGRQGPQAVSSGSSSLSASLPVVSSGSIFQQQRTMLLAHAAIQSPSEPATGLARTTPSSEARRREAWRLASTA